MHDIYVIGSYSTQFKNCWFALQENAGGVIGLERAACSVMILQQDC